MHRGYRSRDSAQRLDRAKKTALIIRRNPLWVDLAAQWYPWMRDEGRDASELSMTYIKG